MIGKVVGYLLGPIEWAQNQLEVIALNDRLLSAVENDDIEEVNEVIQDPRVHVDYAFGKAAEKGNAEIVALLLQDRRVNPASNANYALRMASENGHADVVELLLALHVVRDNDDGEGLEMAIENGHAASIDLYLKHSGETMVQICDDNLVAFAKLGDLEHLKKFIAHQVASKDKDAKDVVESAAASYVLEECAKKAPAKKAYNMFYAEKSHLHVELYLNALLGKKIESKAFDNFCAHYGLKVESAVQVRNFFESYSYIPDIHNPKIRPVLAMLTTCKAAHEKCGFFSQLPEEVNLLIFYLATGWCFQDIKNPFEMNGVSKAAIDWFKRAILSKNEVAIDLM